MLIGVGRHSCRFGGIQRHTESVIVKVIQGNRLRVEVDCARLGHVPLPPRPQGSSTRATISGRPGFSSLTA
jgi:hypothetical protein